MRGLALGILEKIQIENPQALLLYGIVFLVLPSTMGFLSFEVLSRLDWLLSIFSSPYFYLKLKSRSRFYNLPPHQIQHSLGSLQFLLHIAPTVDVEINLTRSVSLPKQMKIAWEKRGRAW
jgi:hypothetical protein